MPKSDIRGVANATSESRTSKTPITAPTAVTATTLPVAPVAATAATIGPRAGHFADFLSTPNANRSHVSPPLPTHSTPHTPPPSSSPPQSQRLSPPLPPPSPSSNDSRAGASFALPPNRTSATFSSFTHLYPMFGSLSSPLSHSTAFARSTLHLASPRQSPRPLNTGVAASAIPPNAISPKPNGATAASTNGAAKSVSPTPTPTPTPKTIATTPKATSPVPIPIPAPMDTTTVTTAAPAATTLAVVILPTPAEPTPAVVTTNASINLNPAAPQTAASASAPPVSAASKADDTKTKADEPKKEKGSRDRKHELVVPIVRDGSTYDVKSAIDRAKLDINWSNQSGNQMTYLMYACDANNLPVVKYLRTGKVSEQSTVTSNVIMADPSLTDKRNWTALMYLLNSSAKDIQDTSAAYRDVLTNLLQSTRVPGSVGYYDINMATEGGMTYLMMAAMKRSPAVIQHIIAAGANPNATDKDGDSALMCAARCGCFEAVKLLNNNGASLNIRNKNGQNALFLALYSGSKETVDYLISENIDCTGEETSRKKSNKESKNILAILVRNSEFSKEQKLEYILKFMQKGIVLSTKDFETVSAYTGLKERRQQAILKTIIEQYTKQKKHVENSVKPAAATVTKPPLVSTKTKAHPTADTANSSLNAGAPPAPTIHVTTETNEESNMPKGKLIAKSSNQTAASDTSTIDPTKAEFEYKRMVAVIHDAAGSSELRRLKTVIINSRKNQFFDINIRDKDDHNRTPLMHAVKNGACANVDLLVLKDFGPKVPVREKTVNNKPLVIAVLEKVQLDLQDREGNTALHLAVIYAIKSTKKLKDRALYIYIIKTLLKNVKTSITIENNDKNTALKIAKDDKEIMELFKTRLQADIKGLPPTAAAAASPTAVASPKPVAKPAAAAADTRKQPAADATTTVAKTSTTAAVPPPKPVPQTAASDISKPQAFTGTSSGGTSPKLPKALDIKPDPSKQIQTSLPSPDATDTAMRNGAAAAAASSPDKKPLLFTYSSALIKEKAPKLSQKEMAEIAEQIKQQQIAKRLRIAELTAANERRKSELKEARQSAIAQLLAEADSLEALDSTEAQLQAEAEALLKDTVDPVLFSNTATAAGGSNSPTATATAAILQSSNKRKGEVEVEPKPTKPVTPDTAAGETAATEVETSSAAASGLGKPSPAKKPKV